MESLGVKHVYQGRLHKLPAFQDLTAKLGIEPEAVAYVGDDVVDLPIMVRVGLAIAVADAHPLVARHAHWQTANPGGRGAARDVCELVLDARGELKELLRQYAQ